MVFGQQVILGFVFAELEHWCVLEFYHFIVVYMSVSMLSPRLRAKNNCKITAFF